MSNTMENKAKSKTRGSHRDEKSTIEENPWGIHSKLIGNPCKTISEPIGNPVKSIGNPFKVNGGPIQNQSEIHSTSMANPFKLHG